METLPEGESLCSIERERAFQDARAKNRRSVASDGVKESSSLRCACMDGEAKNGTHHQITPQ